MSPDELYIWVNRWDEFQTFQVKKGKPWAPPWIKLYPSLLDDPEFNDLPPATQSLLIKLWMLFARTRGTIRLDTPSNREGTAKVPRSNNVAFTKLSRSLGQRVTKHQMERLNHAGWIDFCSGTVLERRRNAFWNSSTLEVEVEVEVEEDIEQPSFLPTSLVDVEQEGEETFKGRTLKEPSYEFPVTIGREWPT